MIVRYITAGFIAFGVTYSLFFLMQAIISMEEGKVDTNSTGKVIEFVRLKRDSDVNTRKRKLPEKVKPEEPPPPPDIDMSSSSRPTGSGMAVGIPTVNVNLDLQGGINLGAAPSDTDIVPLVRVSPQYPIRATERGIEGWVNVMFTISASGTVKNPVVTDSHPSSIFNRAAIKAIKKWKYRPKVDDGVAVERPGVEVHLKFELEDT